MNGPEFKRKAAEQLARQVAEAESKLQGVSILPKELKHTDLSALSIQEIKSKWPRRYEMYLSLLRAQPSRPRAWFDTRSEREPELTQEDTTSMRRWIAALNSLDAYIAKHKSDSERILKDKQATVFEDMREYLERGNNSGFVRLPTGVGKTVLFIEFIKALQLKTLIVVPTKVLVDQTKERITQFAPEVDAGRIYGDMNESGQDVTITTYDSFVQKVKDGRIRPKDFDCLVLDEAHLSLTKARAGTADEFMHAFRIGFTATDEYSDEKKVGHLLGNEIHTMTIREAVEEGLLCSCKAIVARTQTDMSRVSISSTGEYNERELSNALNKDARNKAAVDLYKEMFSGKSAIAYCIGVQHAHDLALRFTAAGITAEAVSGETSDQERAVIFERFARGETKVLCNARLLVTGFDEPRASVCFNLRPTKSKVVAEQRGGRVLRLDPQQPDKVAYIVDFLDAGYSPQRQPVLFASVAQAPEFVNPKPLLGNSSIPGGATNLLMHEVHIEGLHVVVDPEEVMSLISGMHERAERKEWLPFDVFVQQVRDANLASVLEYQNVYVQHKGWPSNPDYVYSELWKGYPWLFTGQEPIRLTWNEFVKSVRDAGVKSWSQYRALQKTRNDWPANPHSVYGEEWQGATWLWTGKETEEWPSFAMFVQELRDSNIDSTIKYQLARKHGNRRWPSNPAATYAREWQGWNYIFGRETVETLPWEDWLKQVRESNTAGEVTSSKRYQRYYHLHKGWPANPWKAFDDWPGWDVVFEREVKEFLSMDDFLVELREAVEAGEVVASTQYKKDKIARNHSGWPADPASFFGVQWPGWNSLFGRPDLLPLNQFVQELKAAYEAGEIRIATDYRKKKIYKNHAGWPSTPEERYGEEWPGWDAIIPKVEALPLENFLKELTVAIQGGEITSGNQYKRDQISRKHPGWPGDPNSTYGDAWPGWNSFFDNLARAIPIQDFLKEVVTAWKTGEFKTGAEYVRNEIYRKHKGWPKSPYTSYGKDWPGWEVVYKMAEGNE
jgi:superfamily II DNA or RNA helicase